MTKRAVPLFPLVSLALLAAAPYLACGSLRTFILLDDSSYVYENPIVLKGITAAGLRWAFTTFHTANWHPLTWISHMLDASLFGTVAWGHHLTSVLLHALNTALLAVVLARLTGKVWLAWCAAALFGVHPLRVESVAWVAERKDVLAGLVFMLVLLAYERYARRGGTGRYLLVAGLLAFGLMAKPMLVTVPFVLLLLDWWPLGRLRAASLPGDGAGAAGRWGRLLIEKIPLLALSAASCVVTVVGQSAAVREGVEISLAVRLANTLVSYAGYLGKTLWPASLAIVYPHPLALPPWWRTTGAVLLLGFISLAALRWAGRRPYLVVGWLWFLGMLVPVIGLVQVGGQALADRYTYLPAVGLSLLLVWGIPETFRRLRLPGAVSIAAIFLALALLTAVTAAQVGRWRDSETLFRHTLAVTEKNWVVHNNLGFVLERSGRFSEAIEQYRKAVTFRPDSYTAHYNLGLALYNTGRLGEAISHFRSVIGIRPDYAEAYNDLGIALDSVGQREEAILHYRAALRLRPGYPNALYNLGLTFQDLGRFDEAVACLQEAVRLQPDFVAARERLGMILGEARRLRR